MPMATDSADLADGGVVVSIAARGALRTLRPVVRVVLEDVALDAAWRDGRLISYTSARLVAEHIGVDAGTAASALRMLRERGIVELAQSAGANGRFGLAAYTVHLPAGMELVGSPRPGRPHTVRPHAVEAVTATMVTNRAPRSTLPSRRGEQGALDLGLGTR